MCQTRRLLTICFSAATLVLSACGKHQGQGVTAAASAPASAAATGTAAASPAAGALSAAPPAATATPQPNLLSWQSGTIVREYPVSPDSDQNPQEAPEGGYSPGDAEKGPWVYLYELPGPAKLTGIAAAMPDKTEQGDGATATFAVSTTGPETGFSDVGTISSPATPLPCCSAAQTLAVNSNARWVRVTVNRTGTVKPISSMAAYGEIAPLPATAHLAGTYVQYSKPYDKSGKFRNAPDQSDPWYLRAVTAGTDGANGEQCFDGHLGDSYPGTRNGRVWSWQSGDQKGTYVVNDEATLLVGTQDDESSYWVRTDKRPKYCVPQTAGAGPVNVVVLQSKVWDASLYPMDGDSVKDAPRYRFSHIGASMVDQALLDSASTLVFNGLCTSDDLFDAAQNQMISQWVANGHKLLIYDADMCGKPTHYAMLPYQFQSNNPGAQGAKGDRLILVEDDSLGTSDKSEKAHYFDPLPYAHDEYNQLGDANTVVTHDPNWCGHLFGTNVNHVNGFMQMYANYGKGLIIYDGFDHDDSNLAGYRRVRMLELTQPIPADLPCTQKASLAFVIEPNRSGKFVPGKPITLTFAMELLANQGWKGHVNVTTSGDFKANVTPNSFDTNGGTQPLKIALGVPGNAKAGTYAVIVNGDGGNNQTAQATIQLTAAVPAVKQFQQRRIRIYGIHFDVDKSTIKPQSEPVIAQIAAVMKQNPSWRFRVEGHTDSDGGYRHNMVLSQHRAESVVNDLVKRYRIARSRLVPIGYGYSRPVAPNTTDAGKALNRRVELVRL